ncbi:hypothetical protein FHX51_000290 [Aeriscardovia aeriphila]|uniref:Uncharacterized protein n=1 Tax=Aeriscardovia aeriphila TaxID=218139 RepID=A0A261FBM3_9BIFI|nr:hypothetical protein [Aeriscardovia aeriphila]OZG56504.1 hypothetical protein AEAE_0992 [Aeriscardovia aeriphila]
MYPSVLLSFGGIKILFVQQTIQQIHQRDIQDDGDLQHLRHAPMDPPDQLLGKTSWEKAYALCKRLSAMFFLTKRIRIFEPIRASCARCESDELDIQTAFHSFINSPRRTLQKQILPRSMSTFCAPAGTRTLDTRIYPLQMIAIPTIFCRNYIRGNFYRIKPVLSVNLSFVREMRERKSITIFVQFLL